MRAFWHFEGIKLFGAAIPYVGSDEYESSVNPQVSMWTLQATTSTFGTKVIDDLKFAYENLPDTWSKSGNYGNVNKWAAAALLAKVMMYESSPYNGSNGTTNRWAEVKSPRDDHGKTFATARVRSTNWLTPTISSTMQRPGTGQVNLFWISRWRSPVHRPTRTSCINGTAHIGMVGALGIGG